MTEFPKLLLGIKEIESLLPHRYPFLLVDRIIEFRPGEGIVGIKAVSFTDHFLQGHFPGNPVMPGVLQIEAIAQVSAVYGKLLSPESTACYLTEVTDTRFRRQVVPGDVMRLEVLVEKQRRSFFWFVGKILVDNEIAATTSFSAKLS